MDRKRASTAPLMLENRSMHGGSQNENFYQQFPSLEPKISKLLPDLPFSLSPEFKFSTSFKEELFDLWSEIPILGSVSQPEVQNTNRTEVGFGNNEQEPSNEEAAADCSPSTSQTRRQTNFAQYKSHDDVPVVDLADSPSSQNSDSSEEDSDVVIYEGTTRREPRMDGSVVCLDNDDQETDNSQSDGDQSGCSGVASQDTEPESSTSVTDPPIQSEGNDDSVSSNSSDSQGMSKAAVPSVDQQLCQMYGEKIESERATVKRLRAELKDQKENCEWQEAKVRYLESKLQERNDFEYKLEAVNQLNDMLEKKVSDLERSATNLPVVEKEVKRLREKTRLLEEDKRCKEELGQTISNLIDDKTNLKTENESLTSIAGMLEKENSTLKQRCETLEKAAEKATVCTGDNLISENCCIRTKELRDRMTESLENEFKCSICEEMFIEATVTNCNHVFCAHCLSEWMKKKRDCPYCRKHVSQQCRAPVIDEFVLTVCKLLSEKMLADRLQVVQERKTLASKKVPQPTPSRKSTSGGSVRVVPIANLQGMPPQTMPQQTMPSLPPALRPLTQIAPYARGSNATLSALNGATSAHNYYSSMRDDLMGYDNAYYFNPLYPSGASSTATASATSSMASTLPIASTLSATASAAPVQMHPLDARIARPHGSAAQSTATASAMHISSTSSSGSMSASVSATLPSATTASSSTALNSSYSTWANVANVVDNKTSLPNFLTRFGTPRQTVTAVNPFASMDVDEPMSSRRTATSHRLSSSDSLASRLMYGIPQNVQDL